MAIVDAARAGRGHARTAPGRAPQGGLRPSDDRLARGQIGVDGGRRHRLRVDPHERLGAAETDQQPRSIVGEELEAVVGREGLGPDDRAAGEIARSLLRQLDQESILQGRIDRPIEMDVDAAVAGRPGCKPRTQNCRSPSLALSQRLLNSATGARRR